VYVRALHAGQAGMPQDGTLPELSVATGTEAAQKIRTVCR
jgi:hypothetical protein